MVTGYRLKNTYLLHWLCDPKYGLDSDTRRPNLSLSFAFGYQSCACYSGSSFSSIEEIQLNIICFNLSTPHCSQDSKLNSNLLNKHGEGLEDKSLTICSGTDYININYQHMVCPDAATAKVCLLCATIKIFDLQSENFMYLMANINHGHWSIKSSPIFYTKAVMKVILKCTSYFN